MLSEEATNTNFIVFGLTRPGLEPTLYRTRGEHANHYATDAVLLTRKPQNCVKSKIPNDSKLSVVMQKHYYVIKLYLFLQNKQAGNFDFREIRITVVYSR